MMVSRGPLADRQAAFLRAIHDEGAPLPEGWGNRQAVGMAVYRGNYRAAVMGSLASVFERTASYAGEKAFSQASINHVIKHPPSGWTLDDAGAGFDVTCAQFFPNSPEVEQLAWLEWAMLQLATAPNSEPLDAAGFGSATAGFGDEEWGELRLSFCPRAACKLVDFDLTGMWRAFDSEAGAEEVNGVNWRLDTAQTCLVWREGELPTFVLVEADHAIAFPAMQDGATYGELIALLIGDDQNPSAESIEDAAMRAGAMLGRWLQEGIVTGINP